MRKSFFEAATHTKDRNYFEDRCLKKCKKGNNHKCLENIYKRKIQDKYPGKNLWDRRTLSPKCGKNYIPRDI